MSGWHEQLDGRASSYLHAVLDKNRNSAEALVREMIDVGSSLVDIYGVLGAAQVEVGALWERGVITVSDEHFATDVTLGCIVMAAEKLRKFRRESKGFAVLCPAEGEFHSVGLRMLSELLRNEGWETELRDSGPLASVFKRLATRRRVDLFCFSATMPSSVARVAEAVRMVRNEPAFKSSKVIVGGPAFRDEEAKRTFGGDPAGPGLADFVASSLPEALECSRSVDP